MADARAAAARLPAASQLTANARPGSRSACSMLTMPDALMMARGLTFASVRAIAARSSRSRSGRPIATTWRFCSVASAISAWARRPLFPAIKRGPLLSIDAAPAASRAGSDRPSPRLVGIRRRQAPGLRLLVGFRVAIERTLEIRQGDHEAGPAIEKPALEDEEPQECPHAVSERAPHADALASERPRAQ